MLVLFLETAVTGVFVSLDLFVFFLFWELELAPMFLLIGIWGGARREYAAMKFIIYTIAGQRLHAGRHPGAVLHDGRQRRFDLFGDQRGREGAAAGRRCCCSCCSSSGSR